MRVGRVGKLLLIIHDMNEVTLKSITDDPQYDDHMEMENHSHQNRQKKLEETPDF